VNYAIGGTATSGVDYTVAGSSGQAIIPAGVWSTAVTLDTLAVTDKKTITLTILPSAGYRASAKAAKVTIAKP
jgi:hypothetical protein